MTIVKKKYKNKFINFTVLFPKEPGRGSHGEEAQPGTTVFVIF